MLCKGFLYGFTLYVCWVQVPLMLKRLHELRKKQVQEESENLHPSVGDRPFSMFGEVSPTKSTPSNESISHTDSAADKSSEEVEKEKRDERRRKMKRALSPSYYSEDLYRLTSTQKRARYQAFGSKSRCKHWNIVHLRVPWSNVCDGLSSGVPTVDHCVHKGYPGTIRLHCVKHIFHGVWGNKMVF